MVSLVLLILVFLFLVLGLGPAWMPASLGRPVVRVTAGIAVSLVVIYLAGFAIYVLHLPRGAHWLVVLLPLVTLWRRRSAWLALATDPEVRRACAAWLALAAWLLGLQFCVFSYSGGTWQADWYEHFDRARFFLGHWDIQHRFLGAYSVTARPPLMNVISTVFLAVVSNKFFVYQAGCTMLASLVVWPAFLLQQRFARPGVPARVGWLVLFLLALPTLAQNAAFTWTKLPAAFFVLVGIALLLERNPAFPVRFAGWLSLTAAMLTHYSAGPWIIAIAVALFLREPRGVSALFQRQSVWIGLGCAVLFGSWLGWSVLRLGWADTLGSNSTVVDAAGMDWRQRLEGVGENLYYTSVPVLLRTVEYGGYYPGDSLAHLRDEYFHSVQSSTLMLAGSLGMGVAAVLCWRLRREFTAAGVRFWTSLLLLATVLGIAVHTGVVTFGVAHICLQPLALLVVAFLAARLPGYPGLQLVHGLGLAFDLLLGVLAHFAVQSLWLHRWHSPGTGDADLIHHFGHAARMNLEARGRIAEPFLYDLAGARWVTALCVGVAVVLLVRAFRSLETNSARASGISARVSEPTAAVR